MNREKLTRLGAASFLALSGTACSPLITNLPQTGLNIHLIHGGRVSQDLSITAEVLGHGINIQTGLGPTTPGGLGYETWVMPTSRDSSGNVQHDAPYLLEFQGTLP